MEKHTHEEHDDHDHGNPFFIPFILILIFSVIELAGGIFTQSLALLSDAWHMVSDVVALGVAMFAAHRAAHHKNTRAERYASIINAVLMLVVIVWILYEAVERLSAPRAVAGQYVMVIAFIGLVINIVVAQRLHHVAHHHGGHENLNHRAALLHVMGDLLGSVAALVSGAIIYWTGWLPVDPILSIVIALLLLAVTANLVRDIIKSTK